MSDLDLRIDEDAILRADMEEILDTLVRLRAGILSNDDAILASSTDAQPSAWKWDSQSKFGTNVFG